MRKKRAREEKRSRGRSKNKGLYYLTFFAVFVIAFILFSIIFLSVLSAFPDRPRVQGLFQSIVELDIPFFKAFVITGRQVSGEVSVRAITIDLNASRTSCVAPCAVFFDATGTTSTTTSRPFHDLDYTWNFGDASSGMWATSGKPKNIAKGGVAAHVFESAGSYTVRLDVKDVTGASSTQTTTITIQDTDVVFAGTNTRCVSTSGNFAGCPSGAEQVTSNDFPAQVTWLNGQSGRRLLMKRGESWNTGRIIVAGQGAFIGAFGIGEKPKIVGDGSYTDVLFSVRAADVRFLDLFIDSTNTASHGSPNTRNGVEIWSQGDDFLFLRSKIVNVNYGLIGTGLTTEIDGLFVIDSEIKNYGYTATYTGQIINKIAFLGNDFRHNLTGAFVTRHNSIGAKAVYSNNHFERPAGSFATLIAIRTGTGYTQTHVIISDNIFAQGGAWATEYGPESTTQDARIQDVIIERNKYLMGPGVMRTMMIWADNVTVRNNVFDITTALGDVVMSFSRRGIEPPHFGGKIYNNIAYRGDASSLSLVSYSTTGMTDTAPVRNNIVWGPQATSQSIGTGSISESNNLVGVDPLWVNPDAGDFHLQSGSPAIDSGTQVPVFDDYDLNARLQGAAWDIGAFEFVAPAMTCISISQYGITWAFDKAYECGQFVNGDYWIVGPVTITSVSPGWDGSYDGSMINPTSFSQQGYQSAGGYSIGAIYNDSLRARFPASIMGNASIVSTIGCRTSCGNPAKSQLVTAAVLTVLDKVPPADAFRPPYFGTDKPIYRSSSLVDLNSLPKLAPVSSTPSFSSVNRTMERVWLDHVVYWIGESIHPSENMEEYGRDIARRFNEASLMLMLNIPLEQKQELAIRLSQIGIDQFAVVKDGGVVFNYGGRFGVLGGGIGSGRKWPILLTGILLNNNEMKNAYLPSGLNLGNKHSLEDCQTFYLTSNEASIPYYQSLGRNIGDSVWGEWHCTLDELPWESDPGSTGYATCCTANVWNGAALSALFLNAKSLWDHNEFFEYEDWYMEYHKSWDGTTDEWQRSWTTFLGDMWDTYRASLNPQCSDGIDNDGDGKTDYPLDRGCESANDIDETLGDLQVPEDRIPDWRFAGVDGGIPNTSDSVKWPVIDATQAPYNANPACDNGDDRAAIQSALDAASIAFGDGRQGTVVYLPAGCYQWGAGSYLAIKSNVVLKGAGDTTIIESDLGAGVSQYQYDGGTQSSLNIHGTVEDYGVIGGNTIAITSGAMRGSTQLTLASVPYAVGDYLWIRENQDPNKFDNPHPGTPYASQIIRISAINGNTITIDRPLRDTFSLSPRVVKINPVVNAGLENLMVRYRPSITGGYHGLLHIFNAVNSWAKNVHFYWGDNWHVTIGASRDITIESSKFEKLDYTEPVSEGGEGGTYNSAALMVTKGAIDILAWNNIFTRVETTSKYEVAPLGNVFAYNYAFNLLVDNRDMQLHGSYPAETLFEGNTASNGHSFADTFWGKQGPRNVWFRNLALGTNTAGFVTEVFGGPANPTVGDLHSYIGNTGQSVYRVPFCTAPDCFDFDNTHTNMWGEKNRFTYLFVRQSDEPTTTYVDESAVCSQNQQVCDGWVGPTVKTSSGQVSTGYNGRQPPASWVGFDLPNSLFLASAPPFWCQEIPWPAIGADVDDVDNLIKLPAQRRAEGLPCTPLGSGQDTNPPTRSNGAPSGTLSTGTTSTTMSLNTNENANCKYAITSGVAYGSMPNTFSTTGGISHSTLVTGLSDGQTYNYYVRCNDTAGNSNANDFAISFSIAVPDTIPPSITGVSATSANSVRIIFNENLDSVSAQNINNYAINNGITISNAILNGNIITLTTSLHTDGINYTLNVSNVRDLAGNTMLFSQRNYTFTSCTTISNSWQNIPFSAQSSDFIAEFDATPLQNNIDGVIGLSQGSATAYSSLAATVRFNVNGYIDARDNATYRADISMPYTANTKYHFKLVVNLSAHRFTIYVTSQGGAEQLLGLNYRFRNGQENTNSLDTLAGYDSLGGNTSVCGLIVNSVTPLCTDTDNDRYNVTGGSCGPVDCNDSNASINPGAIEICTDNIDNNCNGLIDSADPACTTPASPPTIAINEPLNGSILSSGTFIVNYTKAGNQTDVNHTHLILDGIEYMDLDNDGLYQFAGISDGIHTLRAFLVDYNHIQVGNEHNITFTITTTAPPPSDGGTTSGGGGGGGAPRVIAKPVNETILIPTIEKIDIVEGETSSIEIDKEERIVIDIYGDMYELSFVITEDGVVVRSFSGDYLIPRDGALPVIVGNREIFMGIERFEEDKASIVMGFEQNSVNEKIAKGVEEEIAREELKSTLFNIIVAGIVVLLVVLVIAIVAMWRKRIKK